MGAERERNGAREERSAEREREREINKVSEERGAGQREKQC